MELKVWVDGIQKVVCGVTYTTTCQDVVLALACALRQTGRFSLVEKWRDSERPLVPAECPLQSLHRLGEYAGEVRYYLIRAETGTSGQSHVVGQKANVLASHTQRFRHDFTPPDKSHHYLHSPELIKRSSTFSGTHHSLDGTMSSSLPHSSQALSQQRCGQISSAVATVSDSGSYVTSNGKPGGLSLGDINSSSSQSHSRSGHNTLDSCSSKEASQQPPISSRLTFREEAGKYRTAKMLSCHGQDFASSSSSPLKDNSLQRIFVDQPPQETFHSNPGKTQQPIIESSHQYHSSSSSQCDRSVATSQLQQQKQYLSSSQLPHVSDKKPYPVPSPRHNLVRSSSGLVPESVPAHVRLKDAQKPQQRELLHDEHMQSISACVPHSDTNFARSISTDGVSNVISNVHANHTSQQSQAGPTLNHKPSSILRIAREYLQKNGNFQKLEHPGDRTQGTGTLKNTSEFATDTTADVIKYATLDRHFTRSKPHPVLPTRSLSIGHADQDQRPENKPVITPQPGSNGDYLQHCDQEKASLVSKTENSTNSCGNKQMSSFASAVAYVRQYNGNIGNNKANIAHIRQHSEGIIRKPVNAAFHARQHSSDNSYTDNLSKRKLSQSADNVQPVDAELRLGISDVSSKYNTSLSQSNMKPSLSFSCPPLLHNSAPTEVRRQSSHQGSFISQSYSSPTSKTFSENVPMDRIGSVISNSCGSSSIRKQESSHSENVKLEKSGCDENIPDVLTNNAAKYKTTNSNEKLDESREVDTISGQADREYSQLLRTVEMLQERIRLQEAQINSSDLEITSMEEKEVRNKEQLQAILEEICSFEVRGAVVKEELDNLEKTEWLSIIEREQGLNASMNKQITSLKAELEQLESEVKQQNVEEDKNSQEIKSEEEREAQERKQNEELEKQVTSEKEQLDEQLNNVNKIMNEKNLLLEHLKTEILEADKVLNQKEKEVESIEEELKTEANMTNSECEVPSVTPGRTSRGTFPVSDSGEAILKLLECQLSAQSPPSSPLMDEVDNLGGVTSAQHLYNIGSVKTHNGIWV